MAAPGSSATLGSLERAPEVLEIVPDGAAHQIQKRSEEYIAQVERELRSTRDAGALGNRIEAAMPRGVLEVARVPGGAGESHGGSAGVCGAHLVRHAPVFRVGGG